MKRKALLLPMFFVLALLVWSLGSQWYRRAYPAEAFESITGYVLSKDVQVTGYASEITDNFFHRTHYWTLVGPTESLQGIVTDHNFEHSDDAAWFKPNLSMLSASGIRETDLVSGYERGSGERSRWLWLSADKSKGLYAY